MQTTLEMFQFDKIKSGRILESFIDGSGRSQAAVAKEIGLPYDTLRNCLRGAVQQISIERAFKICVATGHSIEEYLHLMLQDVPIDFENRIIWGGKNTENPVNSTHETAKNAVPDAVKPIQRGENISAHNMDNESAERMIERISAQYTGQIAMIKESRGMMKSQYEDEIKMLEIQHEKSVGYLVNDVENLKKDKKEIEKYYETNIKKKNKTIRRLAAALIIENIAIVGMFFYDYFNRDIGYITSIFPNIRGMVSSKS